MSQAIPAFGPVDRLLFDLFNQAFEGLGVEVVTRFSEKLHPPMVLARNEKRSGSAFLRDGDPRFLKPELITLNTFGEGVNADKEAEQLQEACRIALMEAWQEQRYFPGAGTISSLEVTSVASRVSDFATSTGVVQYASLPVGWERYESVWRLQLRPPKQSDLNNPFLRPGR